MKSYLYLLRISVVPMRDSKLQFSGAICDPKIQDVTPITQSPLMIPRLPPLFLPQDQERDRG